MTIIIRKASSAVAWPAAPAPGILASKPQPLLVTIALTAACHSVDLDIEKFGAVTYETVEQVRSALALVRSRV